MESLELDPINYIQRHALMVPALTELVGPIEEHLKTQFGEVKVSIEKCPDLTKWGLAKEGICSADPKVSAIVETGNVGNMMKKANRTIVHSLSQVASALGFPGAYAIGSGALPLKNQDRSGEFNPSEDLATKARTTVGAKVNDDGTMNCFKYDSDVFGMLSSVYFSEGLGGDVLRVEAAKRIGEDNYITAIRKALAKVAGVGGNKQIGLGGAFSVDSGKVRCHAIPLFKDRDDMDFPTLWDFLHRYEAGPELTCMSVLVSDDPTGGDLGMMLEHTHFFRRDGSEAGHFEEGVTKEDMKYVGYFTPAASVIKVNKS